MNRASAPEACSLPTERIPTDFPTFEALFHSLIVTSDLAPKIKPRDHGRGSDGSPRAKPVLLTDLLSGFWYLSSLKTGFYEIHFGETRARQGFQPDRRKKNSPKIRPIGQFRTLHRFSVKFYFAREFDN
jgi:hypothetical protein